MAGRTIVKEFMMPKDEETKETLVSQDELDYPDKDV